MTPPALHVDHLCLVMWQSSEPACPASLVVLPVPNGDIASHLCRGDRAKDDGPAQPRHLVSVRRRPANQVIRWALKTYTVTCRSCRVIRSRCILIELLTFFARERNSNPGMGRFTRRAEIEKGQSSLPPLPADHYQRPLMDTTIYLDYLANRFRAAGGEVNGNARFEKMEDVDPAFDLVIQLRRHRRENAPFPTWTLNHIADKSPSFKDRQSPLRHCVRRSSIM